MSDSGKRVLLGVTGGIAAYKSCELVRLLGREGARVRVVLTESATRFVTPLTFQALSGNPVRVDLFDEAHESAMGHIELARWAEQLVGAPATADFIARLAHGHADDLLTTLCLASEAPLLIAPAMNHRMWLHPATRENVALLESRGVEFVGPEAGEQACGESGPGRMSEPEEILGRILSGPGLFAGRRVMVTAGPTREPLDPVRYLSNRSSGKMGFALAHAFAREGAEVTLVTGPVSLPTPAGVQRVDVETALEMREAVLDAVSGQDLFVGCAAVADYRPERREDTKIKKSSDILELRMRRNPDILAEVAALPDGPFTVGFAAETGDLLQYARRKLEAKGVDMIAANRVGEGAGFEVDRNALEVIWKGGRQSLPFQDKATLAQRLVELIASVEGKD
ncbi:MAG TPA: bifunctional phosphopantothenoylcysteine decarboxylase/phosphopantothenate--cysteine ligase CoaBC [Thiolapillus brandeum]|uniref:Coenzyme A biosynthesis bifunctional protein CoaBC n=1 Tax=Thiolapillus brandeum TaxID=1076588 RepID=A0A7C5MZR7_9GAMM|nr:bifunctional phosphopantothenoylcysteine decarboxylase/phosphopantothenate--cysteine ligase CoaBC [Thiolapillus brandeum]